VVCCSTTRRCSSARPPSRSGRFEAAKASYGRAAALYPQAPSPRLAQSQLALRSQDRARALAAVQVASTARHGPWDAGRPGGVTTRSRVGLLKPGFEKLYRTATAEP
jgi:hypothetical protein